MKKIRVLLIAIIILSAGGSFHQVAAQQKTKAEMENDAKIQQAIDEQKKAMADQKKAQEEAQMLLREKEHDIQNMMNDLQIKVESAGNAGNNVRVYTPRGGRAFSMDESFIGTPGNEFFYGHSSGGDAERTTWDFSKSVKENTFSKDYSFDVENTVKSVVMAVMGDCKAGEIRIKIVMPNGKSYSEIVIDEFGNLNWRKSFAISETENQDKTGEWKFQVSSTKATGYFKISLQTY